MLFRSFKPSVLSAAMRFQASGPQQTSTPPISPPISAPALAPALAPAAGPATAPASIPSPDSNQPPLDSPRMATIQEDPSFDSHLDTEALGAFPLPKGSTSRSFEDLTVRPLGRSDKASSFRLQRQARLNSKETEIGRAHV